MYKFIFIILCLLISGCAQQQQQSSQIANLLYTQDPQTVLKQLQASKPAASSYAQFHLNMGLLQFISGDFQQAIDTLTLAKREMAVLDASSISENIAAATISETLRNYSGYPTDRVMVHNMLALSYLFNNDIDGARVEVLQADVAMKKLADSKDLNGQLASVHLLSGIIYELLEDQSNAFISYKFAADIIKQRDLAIPVGLKQALLRMSFQLGAQNQYDDYQKQFPDFPLPNMSSKNQVFVFYFDGIVSHKKQRSIMVPDNNAEQLIRIAIPAYPPQTHRLERAKLVLKEAQLRTELIEDMEALVRDDLSEEYPSILLMATTRAIGKYQLVKKGNDEEPLLGLLLNVATLLTEVADLRSWNTLPSNIQFAYLETTENEVLVQHRDKTAKIIAITEGSKNVLLINGLSNSVFQYQQ